MSWKKSSRRKFLKSAAGACGAVMAAPMINLGRYQVFANSDTTYSVRAIELMQQAIVIDMLGNLQNNEEILKKWLSLPEAFTEKDFLEFKRSGITIFHDANGIGGADAYEEVIQQFALQNGLVANHGDYFMRIDSLRDLEKVKSTGKIGLILGNQDSEHFRKTDDVDFFYSLGQRVSQLTYNHRNKVGNGCLEKGDGGVSEYGAKVIKRMNEVGMAVDVSHCGKQTTLDAFEISEKPVLITHSNCATLNPGHPRNRTDEAIKKMAATGGVMGITAVADFVAAEEPVSFDQVFDHFDHVARLVGAEHIGVGSDIDLNGYDDMPADALAEGIAQYPVSAHFTKLDIEGLDHPQRMFNLTEGLIGRGYRDEDILGILGGNFKRVLSEIWQ
jgi:membrane dipeptidase